MCFCVLTYTQVLTSEFSLLWSGVVNGAIICTCLFAHSQELVFGNMVLAYCQLSFVSICFASLLGVDHRLAI